MRAPLCLLHTSDWQLGKQYSNLSELHAGSLATARFASIEQLRRLAHEIKADAMLVAGDVFDQQGISDPLLWRVASMLASFQIAVVLLPGNHDHGGANSVLERLQRRCHSEGISNVHVALTAEPLYLLDGRLCVLPAPLHMAQAFEVNCGGWADVDSGEGAYRIGLAHGALLGALPDHFASHNRIPADIVERARLDYLALGDWHGFKQLAERVCYSGTPETDRFRDNASGFALQVQLHENDVHVTPHRTSRLDWASKDFQLNSSQRLSALQEFQQQLDPNKQWVLELTISGQLLQEDQAQLSELLSRVQALAVAWRIDENAQRVDQFSALDYWRHCLQASPALIALEGIASELQACKRPELRAALQAELDLLLELLEGGFKDLAAAQTQGPVP
jgi:DNA repair exonuclease SbcCD nuclease subunit